ncbi:MAG: hypothetical protein RL309_1708 [Verrucomicrobiota bacterium]
MPSPARIRLAQRRGLPLRQAKQLAGLTTPRKIQDFLAKLPQNFEPDGDTARSVQAALTANCAHCIEGAMIAAFALWLQGHPPLRIDLSAHQDMDHVIAPLKVRGRGALARPNLSERPGVGDVLLPRVRQRAAEDAA